MQIAIIGAGKVGTALARAFGQAGHRITLGVRDPASPSAIALASSAKANVTSGPEAARNADIVLLSLPWSAAEAPVKALGDLSGKIVIDCMNPLAMIDGKLGLDRGYTTSGAEVLAGWIPRARLVKTLNQIGADLMDKAHDFPTRPVMFVAGDDEAAKQVVSGLLAEIGFEPLDAGDLSKSRLLEPFAMVWINQAMLRDHGRDWAFAVTRLTP